jgi:DNA-binding FrmR family transcriptional regulator
MSETTTDPALDGAGEQDGHQGHGYAQDKAAIVNRLHRIEGQVRGVEKMVEDDRYCIDILTQISAVTTALDAVALQLLDDHVRHCVRHALASGDDADAAEKTRELLETVRRFTKTR